MRLQSICLAAALLIAVAILNSHSAVAQNAAAKAPARGAPRSALDAAPPAATTPAARTAARGPDDAKAAAPVGAPAPRVGPRAPFELTESQQKLLDQILIKWEQQSDKVKTFKCAFRRWEYNPTFGPEKLNFQVSEASGQVKYAAPDRGEFLVDDFKEYDAKKNDYVANVEGLDHWVCDGKAIYEFNRVKKQLIERPLPPELQGKAISEGPLPFIFGAKADQLKRRYWMRDVTPKADIGKAIWLEAVPKFQQDAANFQRATVILSEPGFMPTALQIILPGGGGKNQKGDPANTAYEFRDGKVNDLLGTWDFTAPRLSPTLRLKGWKHVIEKDGPEEQPIAPVAQPATVKQAKRPAPAGPAASRK